MLARAHAAGVLSGWVTADEAYGQNSTFRSWLADRGVPFVLATRNDDVLISPDGHRRQAKVLATIAGTGDGGGWERRSIGLGRTANGSMTGPPWHSTPAGLRRVGATGCWSAARPRPLPARPRKSWRSTAAPAQPPRRLGRVITVVDRGFSSRENLAHLQRAEGTTSPGNGCATAPRTPPKPWPGKAATSRSATTCGSRKSSSTPRREYGGSFCHNPEEAERDQAARQAAITRITTELDRITAARTKTREQARTRRAATTTTNADGRSPNLRLVVPDPNAGYHQVRGAGDHADQDALVRYPPLLTLACRTVSTTGTPSTSRFRFALCRVGCTGSSPAGSTGSSPAGAAAVTGRTFGYRSVPPPPVPVTLGSRHTGGRLTPTMPAGGRPRRAC